MTRYLQFENRKYISAIVNLNTEDLKLAKREGETRNRYKAWLYFNSWMMCCGADIPPKHQCKCENLRFNGAQYYDIEYYDTLISLKRETRIKLNKRKWDLWEAVGEEIHKYQRGSHRANGGREEHTWIYKTIRD